VDTPLKLVPLWQVGLNQHSSAKEKIALFRSLFRGREDIYPQRFESRKTGRAGYSPACGNEWVRGICEKPRIKCSECAHQHFLHITDDAVRWHLSGRDDQNRPFVMGVYPMLLDETCFFLAADFDKAAWRDDAAAYLETCRRMDMPAALERSRSGNGGHVWLFFSEAMPASLARKLGAHILTETMERRPDIGLDSYDRFFPNQNTLPQGGFGNLIALPLQKRARESGNSVFLDERFAPFPDQWEFLSSSRKICRQKVEEVVRLAEAKGRIIGVRFALENDGEESAPWMILLSGQRKELPIPGPLPESMELSLGNQIYVPKNSLPPALRNRLIRLAAFQNPEFYRAQAMRLPTYDKPRIIACAEDYPKHIGLPRGCMDDLVQTLSDLRIKAHGDRYVLLSKYGDHLPLYRFSWQVSYSVLAQLADGIYDSVRDVYYFSDANQIRVFSVTQGTWLPSIFIPSPQGAAGPQRLMGMAMSPDGTHLAVADAGSDTVYVIDLSNPSSINSFPYASQFPPLTEIPTALALTDSGVVYVATSDLNGDGGCGFLLQLNPSTGILSNVGPSSSGNCLPTQGGTIGDSIASSSDGTRIFFNDDGILGYIDTTSGEVTAPNDSYSSSAPNSYELEISAAQARLFADGFFLDTNLDGIGLQVLNVAESLDANYVYGGVFSADGSLFFQPGTNAIDVFDGVTGAFRARIALSLPLSPNFRALVSDGKDDQIIVITGNGNGIAVINLSSIPEPPPVTWLSAITAPVRLRYQFSEASTRLPGGPLQSIRRLSSPLLRSRWRLP
jgi:YVTN family beta-propeller protein